MVTSSGKECPCCKQTLPDVHPLGVKLTAFQSDMVKFIRRAGPHGIDTPRLFDLLYGDDPDGGPAVGLKAVKALAYYTNRRLAAVGKEIRSTGAGVKRGTYGRYVFRDKGERHGRAT